jgi:hypothetical protein
MLQHSALLCHRTTPDPRLQNHEWADRALQAMMFAAVHESAIGPQQTWAVAPHEAVKLNYDAMLRRSNK